MEFTTLPDDFRWPSGDSRCAATFSITPDVVTARVGISFRRGVDDLDYNRAAHFQLRSSRPVFLVWHDRAPSLQLELYIDAADDLHAARAEAMADLSIAPGEVVWIPESVDAS